jgi:NADPH2:quinone reductase
VRAIQVHETGGPEVLKYEEVADPRPGPGQALIEVQAVGVNYTDTNSRSGVNPPARLPWIPGVEAAGVVAEVGEGVTNVAVGDLVAYAQSPATYAERAVAPAARLVPLPPGVTAQTGAAIILQGMTAHALAFGAYTLKPGDKALVHAGAGGVGHLLIQMAKRAGARVIATAGTAAKAEIAAAAGADDVIIYTEADFLEEVRRLTDGAGVEVVYDGVGVATYERSFDCLKPRGLLALYGASSGAVPPLDAQILNAKGSLFLTRPSLGHYTLTRDELEWRAGDVLSWIEAGDLVLMIDREVPLAQAADAHRALQGRETSGKVLLIP